MKKKEAIRTINRVGANTYLYDASIDLVDEETGEAVSLDGRRTLAVVRGTLLWCVRLLEGADDGERGDEADLRRLLFCVGRSVALEMSGGDPE